MLGDEEAEAVHRVLETAWVTQGPRVEEFEAAVAAYCGAEHAVAVSSCTSGLHLSLLAAGVGPGDEVIVPSMSFIATANSVVHAGATPVFAEIDPATFNLDVDDVRARITERARAIILVHQLGLPADIDAFAALADEHGLRIVEDGACALGSRYQGAPIGSHGELVCLSFHPRKVITTGEGGMILVRSSDLAARLRRLRSQGMDISDSDRHRADRLLQERYVEVGYNYRMTDLQAAIGIVQMERLPGSIVTRQRLAKVYDDALAESALIEVPVIPANVDWNVQSYAVRLRGFDAMRRDRVREILMGEGIATRPGVMTAHREPAYRQRNPHESLQVSEAASDGSLILPLHHGLDEADCREIAALLERAVSEAA